MIRVATYVFMDLETTGLPREEIGKTRITEISFVAVKRNHVLDSLPGKVPRVQHKVTLCLNPLRMIQPDATEVTGVCNDLLEYEPTFSVEIFNILNTFLNVLTKPVCLIAQNGFGFDFPILKNHIERLGLKFTDDVLCADCYHGFYDILEERKRVTQINSSRENVDSPLVVSSTDEIDLFSENTLSMKSVNESTPKTNKTSKINREKINCSSKARRRFPWSKGNKPQEKYKLKNIHERLLNRPAPEAHRAENDCIMAMECAVVLCEEFVQWVDKNSVPFSEVRPMTPGVPIGQ